MKPLYFTTTEPYSFFGDDGFPKKARTSRTDFPPFVTCELKGRNVAYIHGSAEQIAGFDVPLILGGDKAQLDLPISEQEIYMVIGDKEYKCKAALNSKGHIDENIYYLTLTFEEELNQLELEIDKLQAALEAIPE